mmetsp:Transcript_1705/g.3563  ORF Transcript_1705/g.3563 Transcript_1705/m.3563 type:complete len:247 (-) Transcript_1705:24-764(-)
MTPRFTSTPFFEMLIRCSCRDLENNVYVKKFRYDEVFDDDKADAFLQSLFNSEPFRDACGGATRMGSWASFGEVKDIEYEKLNTTVLNMDFFDRLYKCGVFRESGQIVKCFDEYVDGLQCADEFRKCLVWEDGENFAEFTKADRKELIFHVMKRLVVGGGCCQYDDEAKPYLDACKKLYKDLVSVRRNPNTKEVEIVSHAYSVKDAKCSASPLFPSDSPYHTMYISIDPVKRHVTVWYSAFVTVFG